MLPRLVNRLPNIRQRSRPSMRLLVRSRPLPHVRRNSTRLRRVWRLIILPRPVNRLPNIRLRSRPSMRLPVRSRPLRRVRRNSITAAPAAAVPHPAAAHEEPAAKGEEKKKEL